MEKQKNIVNERVIEALNFILLHNDSISKSQFADIFSISRSKFSEILNKRMNAGIEIIQKLYSNFNISPEWVLTGEGEMLKSEEKPLAIKTADKQKGIPLIPIEAMAGYGNGDTSVMDYEIQEDYIITPEFANKGIRYLIRVSGSSMTPKYNNGDLLACRPITDKSFIQWGKVYVLDTDQGPIVKRLHPCNPEDEERLECRSDNSERYPPFKINKTSIRRIAIVVGVLRIE